MSRLVVQAGDQPALAQPFTPELGEKYLLTARVSVSYLAFSLSHTHSTLPVVLV